ncbi:MAG: glycosyltransferase family 4 protein [Phycisphaerales bacterium]
MTKKQRVAVIYQFFAHYRQPIILELINKSPHHYDFLGNDKNLGSGIKLADQFPGNRFKKISGKSIGRLHFQPGAILAALNPKYDALILLGNPYWPTTWLAAILGRLTGKRVLFWTHGWLRIDSGLKRFIRNTFFKLSHGLLLYGHRAKVMGISEGFAPSKLHVIYNSLDCTAQDKARAQIKPDDRQNTREQLFGDRSEQPVLVNITRLNRFKKIDQLIRAAAELEKRGRSVNVLIVGDGEHKEELEALSKELGVHAVFTGALYEELELGRMLNASDCAVMPGPIGLLVMHALAYGVPLISNNNFPKQMPEIEGILPGKTGELFDDDNLESLTDAIERMITQPTSYEQRYTKAREIVERFYNPFNQRKIIDRAIEGHPADDLFNASLKPYSAGSSS